MASKLLPPEDKYIINQETGKTLEHEALTEGIDYKKIKLSQGGECLVDLEDFEYLNCFTWRERSGYVNSSIRLPCEENYVFKNVLLHRLIMGVINENPREVQVDHINNNKFDNRKVNLRIVDASGNAKNRFHRKLKNATRTVFLPDCEQYTASLLYLGVHYELGYFDTEKEAEKAISIKLEQLKQLGFL